MCETFGSVNTKKRYVVRNSDSVIENQFVNSLYWVTSVFFCNVHEKSQWLCLKINFALVMQWILN